MKLTLRAEWRPRAVSSFLGFLDIKTGVKIVLLFAVFNKVAGIYGLIAIFTGGTLAQVSMYIYSVAALAGYYWGFKAIVEESPSKSLTTAHLFLVDHLLSTIWTLFFGVNWWVYNPHDGQRPVNSEAQKELANVGPGHGKPMTDDERYGAAQIIWNREKGLAGGVIVTGWLLKAYFIVLIYSYAIHLRKNTYRSLPLTVLAKQRAEAAAAGTTDDFSYEPVYENELEHDPLDPAYNPQKAWDRERERDIDYDSSDFDENDLERGRGRGRRGVGGSLSIGDYGEFAAGANATSSKQANGGPRSSMQKTSKPNGHNPQSSINSVGSNSSNRHIVPSRPLTSTRKPSQLSKSQYPPAKTGSAKSSKDIQKELEGGSGEVLWDNDEEDGEGDLGTPRSSRPSTRLKNASSTKKGSKQTSSESESGEVSRRAS